MVDRILNENIKRKDLELILEVNKKAIEIETTLVDQNEEIISSLDQLKDVAKKNAEKLDDLTDQSEKMSREIFKIQVLFLTGLLGLVVQIVQLFVNK